MIATQPKHDADRSVDADASVPNDLQKSNRLRRGLKSLLRRGLLKSAAPFQRFLARPAAGSFGILMYHRITPRIPGAPAPTWNVTPRRFRQQLSGLLKRGFQAWPLRKVLDHHRNERPIPQKTFVVTFDDGYANNYHRAWPILRELNIPATIFLATAYIDSGEPFPFDDWSAKGSAAVPAESWIPMTTAQCRELHNDPLIELAAHTHTHRDFRNQPQELRDDLARCAEWLRENLELRDATFAFPYGTKSLGFSGDVLATAAEEAGMLCSLTTESEVVRPHTSPFDWGRFTADQHDTAGTLAVKLTGGFETLRNAWRSLRGRPRNSHS